MIFGCGTDHEYAYRVTLTIRRLVHASSVGTLSQAVIARVSTT
jgi:hypothetical protein